jgi:hypothetical protein
MPASQNADGAASPQRFFQVSLGFKQLARGLHALLMMAWACRRLACGHRHHRNKLKSWMYRIGAVGKKP